jgi:Fe2+ or Zn2+ uptake regulation protein
MITVNLKNNPRDPNMLMNSKKNRSEAEQKLILHNYKLTKPRSELIKLLAHAKKPLSAVEIIDLGQKQKMDRVSIYRILEVFKKAGIIHSVGAAGYVFCMHSVDDVSVHDQHVFLVCDSCSGIEEVEIPDKLKMNLDVQLKHLSEFKVTGQIQISGVCANCN